LRKHKTTHSKDHHQGSELSIQQGIGANRERNES
jgi:hypothetical protein